jgi:hypothetical protein
VLEQIGNPFGIFRVRFATRNRFDVLRIDQDDLQMVFQDIENRSPEHAGRFHGHLLAVLLDQPIAQSHEIGSHGAERLMGFVALPVRGRGDEAGHDGSLVDIQAGASLVEDVHATSPDG